LIFAIAAADTPDAAGSLPAFSLQLDDTPLPLFTLRRQPCAAITLMPRCAAAIFGQRQRQADTPLMADVHCRQPDAAMFSPSLLRQPIIFATPPATADAAISPPCQRHFFATPPPCRSP
jgi:hypothetical protein